MRDFIRKVKSLFKGNKTAQNQAAANAYGVSIDTLEEAARLWEEALKATSEQTANKNAAQTDGGTKFSIKRKMCIRDRAYDIRRVRDAAASLGENGAKALSASYDGSVRADDYYAGFASYYEAGISGICLLYTSGWQTEGKAFSYFSDNAKRIAYFDETATAVYWGLRSPYSNDNYAYYISTDGTVSYDRVYSAVFAPRPAFNLKSSIVVSDSKDSDGCYTVESVPGSDGGLYRCV